MSGENSQLSIRTAKLNDIALLLRWDDKPHVKAATSISGENSFGFDWADELGPRDDGVEFFIAEVGDCPIGAMQIIDPATERTHYWGAVAACQRAIDIWIGEERYLGCGFGTQMMTWAINRCFDIPEITSVLIDPLVNNTRSHRFYESLGFEFMMRRQFEEDSDCLVFKLTRSRWLTPKRGS